MPYIATGNFTDEKEVIGNGQCVTLVKKLTGAPPSSLWKQGAQVSSLLKDGKTIAPGTAIATFVHGRYPNYTHGTHAAIFIRATAGGIEVFDQWKGMKPGKRTIRFGMPKSIGRGRAAENYSVVQ